MPMPRYIHLNGSLVPWDDARIHVMTPCVKYGALVFEGLRSYWNEDEGQLYVLKLGEHLRRFHQTLRVVRFDGNWSDETLTEGLIELVRANEVRQDVHMRIAAWVDGDGLYDSTGPCGLMMAAYGRGSGALEKKVATAGVTSWRRINDTAMPPRLKVAANYHNGRLGILEARANGYREAIFLTPDGKLAEGAGACLFVVRDGVAMTPPVTDGILESVTRRAVLGLLDELGVPTAQRSIDRTELYFAEEAFFCGTGVEIQPISAVDGLELGCPAPGPVTRALWDRYEAVARGRVPDHDDWRLAVYPPATG